MTLNKQTGLLIIAVILVSMVMATVAWTVDRVYRVIGLQTAEVLAADMVITSDQPFPQEWVDRAMDTSLQTARTVQMRTMIIYNNEGVSNQLVELKAVSEEYPLRGKLQLQGDVTQVLPGEVYLDDQAIRNLELVGNSPVTIGQEQFQYAGEILFEPDRGIEFFSIAPRAMVSIENINNTGLIAPGARIQYGLLLAGNEKDIQAFRQWVEPLIGQGQKIHVAGEFREEFSQMLSHANTSFHLAMALSVFIASIAFVMGLRVYLQQQTYKTALYRVLGLSRAQALRNLVLQLFRYAVAGSVAGVILAYLLQIGLASLLLATMDIELPEARFQTGGWALIVCTLLVMTVSLIPLRSFYKHSLISMIQRSKVRLDIHWGWWMLLIMIAIASIAAYLQQYRIVMSIAAGMVLIMLSLSIVQFFMEKIFLSLVSGSRVQHLWLLYKQHRKELRIQVVAISLALVAMAMLYNITQQVTYYWDDRIPDTAPNKYLMDVRHYMVDELTRKTQQIDSNAHFYPMIRGRLMKINNAQVADLEYVNPRARRLADRLFNMSWQKKEPETSKILAGEWWLQGERGFSVEAGIAETLGIDYGDELTFDVGGERISAPVMNIREVHWESFRPNFFVLASPALLDEYPASYFTGIYVADSKRAVFDDLMKTYPQVTVIDVNAILERLRLTLSHLMQAIYFILGFSLIAAILVLFASWIRSASERKREAAMIRCIGMSDRQWLQLQWLESALVSSNVTISAFIVASAITYAVCEYILEIPYQWSLELVPLLFVISFLVFGLTARFFSRLLLKTKPVRIFQESF